MYIPPAFAVSDCEACYQLINDYSFATLIAIPDMEISHLPLFLYHKNGKYTIRGHMAKLNPLVKLFNSQTEVLCIFNGPHGYISPTYYKSNQLNVPTWNYAVVHVKGRGCLTDQAKLREILDNSVTKFEAGREQPWSMYWKNELGMKKIDAIAGFEIEITDITAKFKLNQNRSINETENVIKSLSQSSHHEDTALAVFMQQVLHGK